MDEISEDLAENSISLDDDFEWEDWDSMARFVSYMSWSRGWGGGSAGS